LDRSGRFCLGIDVGGTFTDLVLLDVETGGMSVGKTLTTPADPAIGVIDGVLQLLSAADVEPAQINNVIHGTTLVGNAIIERKGARIALVTTAGFKDVLTFGREFRYDIYDSHLVMPQPLVKRRDRFEVAERLSADGKVILALVDGEVERIVAEIASGAYDAAAISFLHSYVNDVHERAVAEALRRGCPGLELSLSSEILPQLGEFERTTITTMNAYVQPVARKYLANLQDRLRAIGLPPQLYCMASNGGLLTAETAGRYPIRLAESGPVAGSLGAAYYGTLTGTPDLLSFDMGGTTAKACVIVGNRPSETNEFELARVQRQVPGSGLPVRLPAVQMLEVGAGGGSIARVNELGLLTLGPDSAGADPGPACYGRGGSAPTVTDANLVLGYLNPDNFLGGQMQLDAVAAHQAIAKLAAELGLSEERAATGINEMASQDMANALRTHAVEKGIDYRRFTLLAFGGAGPLHAHRIASLLGIGRVVFPANAGAFSAFGMLTAPLRFDVVRTWLTPLAEIGSSEFAAVFSRLQSDLMSIFDESLLPSETVALSRSVDVRYAGQGVELEVALPANSLEPAAVAELFGKLYTERYGWALDGGTLEAVNWRCTATGPAPAVTLQASQRRAGSTSLASRRPIYVAEAGGYRECAVYDRYSLVAGDHVDGPAIIEERESTTWIGPGAVGSVDSNGSVLMEIA
jgi:N-methylhydantoinase A